jgi:hypothetical protein
VLLVAEAETATDDPLTVEPGAGVVIETVDMKDAWVVAVTGED